jgi:hypothetical protein
MADELKGRVEFASNSGIFGSFPDLAGSFVPVGPATESQANRITTPLIPKACWKLEESHFEFDSSFVLPLSLTFDTGRLKALLDLHPNSILSVFGHADPVGRDEYNKTLSGRRALAIYALLVRDIAIWQELYDIHDTSGRDEWGLRSIQIMLNRVLPEGRAAKLGGNVDGVMDEPTRTKLDEFQSLAPVPRTPFGPPREHRVDKTTFRALAKAYMDAICTDDENVPFQLKKSDFLARGEDSGLKGDVQGCGEFNPLLILSQSRQRTLEDPARHKDRNKANQPSRRVMILFFRPGSRVDPARWPCPRTKEGPSACRKRFFSDFQRRVANGPEDREFEKTKDTFACRFYHRMVRASPCETIVGGGFAAWEVDPLEDEPAADIEGRDNPGRLAVDDPRASALRRGQRSI